MTCNNLPLYNILERDETKTPGLRAAEVAAQESLAAISHQDERSLLEDGAVERQSQEDRRKLRDGHSSVFFIY